MKKHILALTVAMVVFTGCGYSQIDTPKVGHFNYKVAKDNFDIEFTEDEANKDGYIYVEARKKGFYNIVSRYNWHARLALKKAAQATLESDAKYFEIIYPEDAQDEKIDSPEKFEKECTGTFFLNPCDIIEKPYMRREYARMIVKTYKTKKDGKNLLNAKEVINWYNNKQK